MKVYRVTQGHSLLALFQFRRSHTSSYHFVIKKVTLYDCCVFFTVSEMFYAVCRALLSKISVVKMFLPLYKKSTCIRVPGEGM